MFMKAKPSILVVEDDPIARRPIVDYLSHKGWQVFEEEDAQAARERLQAICVDVVLTDLSMPDDPQDGLDLVEFVARKAPTTGIVVLTYRSDLACCTEAMRRGARDYVMKPVEFHMLDEALTRALNNLGCRRQDAVDVDLIAESAAMKEVLQKARRYADYNEPVLITGERGTGKEVMAKYIHACSRRSKLDSFAINCAGLSETLLDSELFGHVKGAFTGATYDREGYFEVAKGSTLFLDEIGDASPSLQVKLLRVLQERKLKRVGGNSDITVDVRIIAATNRDINANSSANSFRKDLLERVRVFPLHIPPLRDRPDDIPALVSGIATTFARKNRDKHPDVPTFTSEALWLLQGQLWPGNIRELQNVVVQAVVNSAERVIEARDIQGAIDAPVSDRPPPQLPVSTRPRKSLDDEVREFKLRLVEEVLAEVGGNKTEAAALLGISRKCLYDILATKK